MDEKLLMEAEALLSEAQELIALGENEAANEKIAEAKSKIKRPIGSGTLGPEK